MLATMRNVMRLIASSLTLFILLFLSFELAVLAYPSTQSRPPAKSRDMRVDDLFRNNCARCHGGDGRGDTPLGHTYNSPDFTDWEWWQKNSDITNTSSLVSIVSLGKGGMPAFGKKLTREEIRSLVGYVRKFKNQKPPNQP